MGYSVPTKITANHITEYFRCGSQPLDDWLKRFALINQRAGMATTFVTTVDEEVVGYYALATGGVARESAPSRITKGTANHPIPIILLARLAVHEEHQGKRLGRGLLRDALYRVRNAAEDIGVRAVLIHAKDEEAHDFYMSQAEFEPSPVDPLQLFLLMKDLNQLLQAD